MDMNALETAIARGVRRGTYGEPGTAATAVVPLQDFSRSSFDQLWEAVNAGMVDSPMWRHAGLSFQLRSLQEQTRAATGLVRATWALVGASVLLAVVSIVQLVKG